MLFELKRYIQMRQFVTFYNFSTSQMKTKTTYQWSRLRYSNKTNPTLSTYRLFNTHLKSKDNGTFPVLMWKRFTPIERLEYARLFNEYFRIREKVDKDFKLTEFYTGAKQAIQVVSTALSKKNFEALNGIVKDRAIKVLKHRIKYVSPHNLSLMDLDQNLINMPAPTYIRTKKLIGSDGIILEIGMMGYTNKNIMASNGLEYIYIFQRKYINGIGKDWVVNLLNYSK